MKKVWIAKITVLSLLVLFLLGILVFGIQSGFGLKEFIREEMTYDGESKEYTQAIGDIENLEVNWIAGSVEIKPYSGDVIRITETASRETVETELLGLEEEGSTLKIDWKKARQPFEFFSWTLGKKLTIEIPQAMSLSQLKVTAASADINISGLSADKVEIRNTSGDVGVGNFSGEEVSLHSKSGNIASENCKFSSLRAETSSGEIAFSETSADALALSSVSGKVIAKGQFTSLEADTISGAIEAVNNGLPDSVTLESVTGAISLTVPENITGTVEYSSISGDFSTSFDNAADLPESGEKSGVFHLGEGIGSVRLSTTSGNMALNSGVKASEPSKASAEQPEE